MPKNIRCAIYGLWVAIIALATMTACSTESYETGDGDYSYLMADLGMAHTIESGKVDRFVTDGGVTLLLSPNKSASWATTADSLYRALLYYNSSEKEAEPVYLYRVPVMTVYEPKSIDAVPIDPITLSSIWLSKDKEWLNFCIELKTGKADDEDAEHSIGLAKEKVGDDEYVVRIVHDQGGVPEYYSSTLYMSLRVTEEMRGKTFMVNAMTYDGYKTLTVAL